MSDRPIAVGDLVQVVRACCQNHHRLGFVSVVDLIDNSGSIHSKFDGGCGIRQSGQTAHLQSAGHFSGFVPASWLKRIPPLKELEGGYESYSGYQPMKEPA